MSKPMKKVLALIALGMANAAAIPAFAVEGDDAPQGVGTRTEKLWGAGLVSGVF